MSTTLAPIATAATTATKPVATPVDPFAPAFVDWQPTEADWIAEFWTSGPGAEVTLDF